MGGWGLPRTIGGRLTWALLAASALPLLALLVVLPPLVRAHELAALDARLAAEARLLAEAAAPVLVQQGPDALTSLVAHHTPSAEGRLAVLAPDGRVLADSGGDPVSPAPTSLSPDLRAALAGQVGFDQRAEGGRPPSLR